MLSRDMRLPFDDTPRSLIRRAQREDDMEDVQDARTTLFRIYTPFLLARLQRRFGLSLADAEEVCQTTWITVLQRLPRFCHEGNDATFTGWILAIAQNKFLEFVRRRKKDVGIVQGGSDSHQHLQLATVDGTLPWQVDADSDEYVNLRLRALAECLAMEKALDREIVLAQSRGETSVSIAERLGMQPSNVRMRSSRARNRLRVRLREILNESSSHDN